jgi:hypothetical protein
LGTTPGLLLIPTRQRLSLLFSWLPVMPLVYSGP